MVRSHFGLGKSLILLGTGLLGCLAMVGVRFLFTGHWTHAFLLWNLVLALVPLAIAGFAQALTKKGPFVLLLPLLFLLSLAWLIFFPNSSYIFTDFIHLIQRGLPIDNPNARGMETMLLWYDVIVRSLFAFTGHFLGLVSLLIMHRLWRRFFGRLWGWIFVFLASFFAGYGVFVGRFLRLNSWSLFTYPDATWHSVLDNLLMPDAWFFSLSIAFFLGVSYLFVYLLNRSHWGDVDES
jgi:uncharacterized membrane protein